MQTEDGARRACSGAMSSGATFALASLVLVSVLVVALVRLGDEPERVRGGTLTVLCAAGLRDPIELCKGDYREEYGVEVRVEYAGSGSLLGSLPLRDDADVYIAGDGSFIDRAAERSLVDERLALAFLRPVLAVPAGNPRGLRGLADLRREDVKVALGDPGATAVGKCSRRILESLGWWEEVFARCEVTQPTVDQLATSVKLGAADAAIVWDATVHSQEGLEAIEFAEGASHQQRAEAAVLKSCARSGRALHFLRYLSAPGRGGERFGESGFRAAEGDRWADRPVLELSCGAMLSPAVDDAIKAFQARENVEVATQYAGCGLLVASMRSGEVPDAYFSCEVSYYDMVDELFEEPVVVSANQMVILVEKGNPKEVHEAKDLSRPELEVGVCSPEMSALGGYTREYMRSRGLWEEFRAGGNRIDASTADFLVAQMVVGALDAAVVYRSNAAHAGEHVDVIPLSGDDSFAHQPYGVASDSPYPALARRLFDFVTRQSEQRFLDLGFRWELGE